VVDEDANRASRLVQTGELMQATAPLLQRPQEALDNAVALGLADVARRDVK
jgi:hypothetical protein